MKKKTKRILIIFLIFVFIASIGLAAYPLISSWENNANASKVQANYENVIADMKKDDLNEEWQKAFDYNQSLCAAQFSKTGIGKASENYKDILNINNLGIMCYVSIPKIGLDIPVYHGTSGTVLEKGAGHLIGTSVPVGGDSTHAVISAHSGVATHDKSFSDLEKIKRDDIFYVKVLNETHAYQVFDIQKVLPDEVDSLVIQRGKDLCTLVTCTPFGVNTHRLLVMGTRIPYEEAEEIVNRQKDSFDNSSVWAERYSESIIIGIIIFAVILAITLLVLSIKSKKKRKKLSAAKKTKEEQENENPEPENPEISKNSETSAELPEESKKQTITSIIN